MPFSPATFMGRPAPQQRAPIAQPGVPRPVKPPHPQGAPRLPAPSGPGSLAPPLPDPPPIKLPSLPGQKMAAGAGNWTGYNNLGQAVPQAGMRQPGGVNNQAMLAAIQQAFANHMQSQQGLSAGGGPGQTPLPPPGALPQQTPAQPMQQAILDSYGAAPAQPAQAGVPMQPGVAQDQAAYEQQATEERLRQQYQERVRAMMGMA